MFVGEGRPLFSAVCKLDLEGVVAKRMADPYGRQTKWWKIPNPIYSRRWCEVSCSKPPPSEVKKREPSIIGTTRTRRRASNFFGHRPTEGAIRVRAAPYVAGVFGRWH